ncbi:hypothetical protein SEA_CASSIA_53 [Arthrobacter phage Cassia]|uniref:Uncharacterized protein n=1 Tax=Arthrobacter phage Cassia TaxID=2927275 RepID=A0AAF0GLN5_9CAUD|nr:hypothetical protein SEA_CASSIA_53 [Arthrobacter phage Cassia]
MKRPTLGERAYRHNHVGKLRLARTYRADVRDKHDRYADYCLRYLIRHYRNAPVIHNGRKPRNV